MRIHTCIVLFATGALSFATSLAACSNGSSNPSDAGADGATYDPNGPAAGNLTADDDHPPTTSIADLTAWLQTKKYTTGNWQCETAPHPMRSPSPHGMQNRICSNMQVSTHATTDEYPVGASSVKELFGTDTTKIVGYAVTRHFMAGKGGDSWFFYETVPASSLAPHDSSGTVAFGAGSSGAPKTVCVGCHSAAGSDSAHSGHDFVYTQVGGSSGGGDAGSDASAEAGDGG
jgi:hypothetical protein